MGVCSGFENPARPSCCGPGHQNEIVHASKLLPYVVEYAVAGLVLALASTGRPCVWRYGTAGDECIAAHRIFRRRGAPARATTAMYGYPLVSPSNLGSGTGLRRFGRWSIGDRNACTTTCR